MNWINKTGKDHKEFQEDEVGNQFQKQGGVKPKACQKCKKEFKSEIVDSPVIQKVNHFECMNCDYRSSTGEGMLFHLKDFPKHEYNKVSKDRVIKIEKTLSGVLPYITKTEDDVIILCGVCNADKS